MPERRPPVPQVVRREEEPPAMSISFADESDRFSGFLVFFAEHDPDSDDDDSPPTQFLCLHCLLEDGDEQLVRKVHEGFKRYQRTNGSLGFA